MKIIKKCLWLIIILLLVPVSVQAKEKVRLYLFYSETCPHCAAEEELLNKLEDKYDYLEIHKYEVSESNTETLINQVFDKLNYHTNGVPFTVIGSKYFSGYNTNVGYQIEDTIRYYSKFEHKDVVGEILGIVPPFIGEEKPNGSLSDHVVLPFIGEINPKSVSLPLIAVIIGLVDGFNPCAMWVLIFLISMLLGMKNRKRMWILGITFLLTSALIYLAFMFLWLNVAIKMNQIVWLRLLIASLALVGAVINVKSFFKSAPDGCEVTDDKKRKQIFNKIKKFTTEKSFFLAIIGIMGLAITVNFVELACSAGLPLLFTQILAVNDLSIFAYIMYIFIYILFFLLDDLIIFIVAMITLKVTGISTKYTKWSHLIGGIIMLLIALLMLYKPEWLMFNF